VIIISTVRSSDEHVTFDVRHNLGFLENPKRFNVAITRAQSLLIVVGNPNVLAIDTRHWGALLRLCIEHGAYRGVQVRPEAMSHIEQDGGVTESLADDMEALLLDEPSLRVQQESMEMPIFE